MAAKEPPSWIHVYSQVEAEEALVQFVEELKRLPGNRQAQWKLIARHRREVAQATIDKYKHVFDKTQNPLFAWAARRIARVESLPVPDWVEAYLDTCGEALTDPGTKPDLRAALGMKTLGRGSIFTRYRDLKLRLDVVEMIFRRRAESPDLSLQQIFGEVVWWLHEHRSLDLSVDTVERWYFDLLETPK